MQRDSALGSPTKDSETSKNNTLGSVARFSVAIVLGVHQPALVFARAHGTRGFHVTVAVGLCDGLGVVAMPGTSTTSLTARSRALATSG